MVLLILAMGLALGVDPRRLALLGVMAAFPAVVLVPAGLAVWARSGATDSRPALFCQATATELRAGSPLSGAIAGAARAVGADQLAGVASAGTVPETALAASRQFPAIARELELVIVRSGGTGAAAADLFDEIGALALAQEEIRREVRVAVAPARAATAVFVFLPAAYLAARWAGGDLQALFSSHGQRAMGVAGLGLFLVGLALAVALVWRSR